MLSLILEFISFSSIEEMSWNDKASTEPAYFLIDQCQSVPCERNPSNKLSRNVECSNRLIVDR